MKNLIITGVILFLFACGAPKTVKETQVIVKDPLKTVEDYHDNGQLYSIGKKNSKDKSVGEWKYYYSDGGLSAIRNYSNGVSVGEWKWYHKNGSLSTIGNYSNGYEVGEWKWYHDNGTISSIGNYSNGYQVGEWKRYQANGELREVESFYNINKNASKKDFIELRGVSKFTKNSKTNTRVDLKFTEAQYRSIIYKPGSSLAYFLLDDKGKKYRLIGQEGWRGDDTNGFGRLSKSYTNLLVSLDFENVSLDDVKTLDLIEGDTNAKNNWHIFNILSENRIITYESDECLSGDCKDGIGTYKWSTGEKYTGEFKYGRKSGKGTMFFVNGDKYIGEFEYDKFDGMGIYYSKDGDKFEGRFEDNTLRYGTSTFRDGTIITGTWNSDWELDGDVTYKYKNGDVYEGEFENNKRDGFGVLTEKDGSKFIGLWKNDYINGEGIYYPISGNIFKGSYKDGKRVKGITYSNPSENKLMIDKYFNSEIGKGYSSRVKKVKKKQSFEKIVSLFKKGVDLYGEKIIIESIDYNKFKIVVSETSTMDITGFFGGTSNPEKFKKFSFLDFNDLSSFYIEAWDSEIKTSIYFEDGFITRMDNLSKNEKGEIEKDSFESFNVYFVNNLFDVIELNNEIEKFKKY